MKKISERNIAIRLLVLFIGLIIIAFSVEVIKLVLKLYFNVTFGGAIPALLFYGLPLYFLFSWVGFTKSKSVESSNTKSATKGSWETPEKDKW